MQVREQEKYGGAFQKYLLTLKSATFLAPPRTKSPHLIFHLPLLLNPVYQIFLLYIALYTDIATRALIVALKSPFGGKLTNKIYKKTGVKKRTINDIYARAIQRGFDPNLLFLIIKNKFF